MVGDNERRVGVTDSSSQIIWETFFYFVWQKNAIKNNRKQNILSISE